MPSRPSFFLFVSWTIYPPGHESSSVLTIVPLILVFQKHHCVCPLTVRRIALRSSNFASLYGQDFLSLLYGVRVCFLGNRSWFYGVGVMVYGSWYMGYGAWVDLYGSHAIYRAEDGLALLGLGQP